MKNKFEYARYISLGLVVLLALNILSTLLSTGLEFDESFNLQVPLNLYLHGEYQTWYNGLHKFHYLISTGPTVFFPIYILFSAFSSTSVLVARIVTFGFSLLFIWLICREFLRGEPAWQGTVFGSGFILLLFFVPEFSVLSVRVLGEVPGIALIAASYWLFASGSNNRRFLAGLLFGLAVLSKLIFLMAVVPVLLVAVLDAETAKMLRHGAARLGYFFSGMLIPLACWQAFKLSSLGLEGYIDAYRLQSKFVQSMTSGAPGGSFMERAMSVTGTRIGTLVSDIGMPGAAGYVFLLVVAASVALAVYAYMKDSRLDRFYIMVLLFGLVHTGWWAMLNIVDYYRHLFPGLLMLVAGISLTLFGISRSRGILAKPASVLFAVLFVMLTVFNRGKLLTTIDEGFTFAPSREALAQKAYAEKVAELASKGYLFYGYEWLQVPELSYLSGVRFFSVYDKRSLSYLAKRPGVLIVSDYNFAKDRELSMKTLADFTDVGPGNLADAGFPAETPYVFAPVTRVGGRRLVSLPLPDEASHHVNAKPRSQ